VRLPAIHDAIEHVVVLAKGDSLYGFRLRNFLLHLLHNFSACTAAISLADWNDSSIRERALLCYRLGIVIPACGLQLRNDNVLQAVASFAPLAGC